MNRLTPQKFVNVTKVISLTLVPLFLMIVILSTISSPAAANQTQPSTTVAGLPPARPLPQQLTVVKEAVSNALPGDGTVVNNGDWVTFTITIAGAPAGNVTELVVTDDILQTVAKIFNTVECLTPSPFNQSLCQVVSTTETIFTRAGPIDIVTPVQVKWTFPVSTVLTAADFPLSFRFRARVGCPQQLSYVTASSFLSYKDGATQKFGLSNNISTQIKDPPPAQTGKFSFSPVPELCTHSGPVGGTSDLDWGDFDNDGDLDVALISWGPGVYVYENKSDIGTFELLWQETPPNNPQFQAEGVRWGDFDNDGYMELLLSGSWAGVSSRFPDDSGNYFYTGYNYMYRYDPGTKQFAQYHTFNTNDGAWRAEVADFTDDGYQDVVMVNYWGGCTAHLYKNNGSGEFNRGTPPEIHSINSQSYCLFTPPPAYSQCCSGNRLGYSAAWGDYDNDGDLDLAIGYSDFSTTGTIRVYINNNGVFNDNTAGVDYLAVDTFPSRYPYDLAWGDYDGDGRLDLAAAFASSNFPSSFFSTGGAVRVYRNTGTFNQTFSLPTARSVGAIDWADFDGDGEIELAVAEYDSPPKIYKRSGTAFSPTPIAVLETSGESNILSLRGVDHDNDGDVDLSFSNFKATSWLFNNTAPFLRRNATSLIGNFVAEHVVWGDVNNDNFPDLLYGTGTTTKLHNNDQDGTFSNGPVFAPNLTSARTTAMADVDNDGDLDAVMGGNGQSILFRNNLPNFVFSWVPDGSANTHDLQFSDVDQDNAGRQDLIVGNDGANQLYLNPDFQVVNATPRWSSPLPDTTQRIDWGYFNDDVLPDFVAANDSQPTRIYANGSYYNFTTGQELPAANTRDAAWADFDGDGDMDLALGNYGRPIQLYRNNGGTLALAWTAPFTRQTTSLAWADWDNDGDMDLGVGNYKQPDQVYVNIDSTPAQVNFYLLWEAAASYWTTDLAWGDFDGDGDRDLAISQDGTVANGIYENTYARSSHLTPLFSPQVPLPRNPSYLAIDQPGLPNQIFKRTILSDATTLNIPINFRVYDPDGSRLVGSNLTGDSARILSYQYSLNNGGNWQSATVTPALTTVASSRQGQPYNITWQAGQDMTGARAVNDLVRFRITMVSQISPTLTRSAAGPVQRLIASTISPPFRVRNLGCVWPENATIVPPTVITAGEAAWFLGQVALGPSGAVFNWDFGDDTPPADPAQFIPHTYQAEGTYPVTLTVTGDPCPLTRLTFITTTVTVGQVFTPGSGSIYLPIITKGAAPDLVGSFTVSEPSPIAGQPVLITAVITNQGSVAAGAFWTDFYINPAQTPAVNKRWNDICQTICKGIAWFIPGGLAPGQAVTVTSASFPDGFSDWDGSFPSGVNDLQLFVDVWNPTVSTGAVFESNENNNRSQVPFTVAGLAVAGTPATQVQPRPAPTTFDGGVLPLESLEQVPQFTPAPTPAPLKLDFRPGSPAQITAFQGSVQSNGVTLQWEPHPEAVQGYRLYRAPATRPAFTLLADLPPDVTSYTDQTATCGQAYFVTAYHAGGESLPSTASYYSPPCN